MSTITRVNIESVIGVSFDENMSTHEMKETLVQGVKNIENTYPDLAQSLNDKIIELDNLTDIEKKLIQQAIDLQEIEKSIESGEKVFREAVNIYSLQDSKVVGIIGSAGGMQPPYPQASGELAPLSSSINIANSQLDNLKEQLANGVEELTKLTDKFSQDLENFGNSVILQIQNVDSTIYDLGKESFIFTK